MGRRALAAALHGSIEPQGADGFKPQRGRGSLIAPSRFCRDGVREGFAHTLWVVERTV
jgi:hypothetical protein